MANQYRVKTGVKLYTQVLEQVKSMIAQGVYKKGDLLPSEKELIEMMGVSRITVRKALQILSEAGVIETRKGKGSFVAVDASELAPASMDLKKYCESFVQATRAGCCWNPPLPGRPPRPPPRRNWNSCARMSTRPCRWIVSTMCWWKWCITRW